MSDIYSELSKTEDTKKARLICYSAFAASFIFYYFMMKIGPTQKDFFWGRVFLCIVALLSLGLTYIKSSRFDMNRIAVNFNSYAYFLVYLYLLHANDWSVFHRWSYFVVGVILCSCALTWKDYLTNAFISIFFPLLVSFFGPLSFLEAIHFHAANFTMFLVIGFSVRSNFIYKKKVSELSKDMIDQSKMSALGEMAGGMSHEINNPLTVIAASSKQIKAELESENIDIQKTRELILKIDRMVERIARIIKALRDFSTDGYKDEFKKIDMRDLVKESLQLYGQKFSVGNVKLHYEEPKYPLYCMCQESQFLQVLIHLFSNAYDACIEKPSPTIDIELFSQDNFVYLTVSDNGGGISPAIAGKIMQPFFTTKEFGKGAGMGLSVSLGIVSAHQGEFFYEPNNAGSRFIVKLPMIH